MMQGHSNFCPNRLSMQCDLQTNDLLKTFMTFVSSPDDHGTGKYIMVSWYWQAYHGILSNNQFHHNIHIINNKNDATSSLKTAFGRNYIFAERISDKFCLLFLSCVAILAGFGGNLSFVTVQHCQSLPSSRLSPKISPVTETKCTRHQCKWQHAVQRESLQRKKCT